MSDSPSPLEAPLSPSVQRRIDGPRHFRELLRREFALRRHVGGTIHVQDDLINRRPRWPERGPVRSVFATGNS